MIKKLRHKEDILKDNNRDLAIRIVDTLVQQGFITDCLNTDNMDEFIVQDIITEALNKPLI